MRSKTLPRSSFVSAAPHFAAGRPEIQTRRLSRIDGHRLALDGVPGLSARQARRLTLPSASPVHRAIHARLAARRNAWPYAAPIHGKNPGRIRVTRMQHHRKPNGAYALGHAAADVLPLFRRPVEAVDARVVLLVEPIRLHSG